MKSILIGAVLLAGFSAWSQPGSIDAKQLIQQERQAFERKMQFQANPNTQNYDVKYHKLELSVNPANYYISGKVTTRFVPNQLLSSIVFDLADELNVSQVKQGNTVLTYTHTNNQLMIQLAQTVAQGVEGTVEITYAGEPATANDAFTTSYHNGVPVLWTLSQPFGAKDWFPCKDDLTDKIENIDFYITAPSAFTVAANGLEVSQTPQAGGMKTTHFQHNYPIPAYLVAFAVTNYQVYTQQAGTAPDTFPIVNYLYPENYNTSVNQVVVTLDIMNLFENLFETYPFHEEKYGHAEFGWGGGMEHTTVSFMGMFSRDLIAHELAHHWFGDKITCGTWKDIWLNEGFAEYLSGLVVEHMDGPYAFVSWKNFKNMSITSQAGGNLYLTDDQAQNSNRIFSGRLTYDKGSMVVHMLRYVLGDAAFFQGMKNYLADPDLAYGSAVTTQLKQHLEAASGKDLTTFFANWVYGEGYPSYQANVYMVSDHQAKITLSQTTSHSSVVFFEMPVEIRITGPDNQQHLVQVNHTQNNQEFIVAVPFSSIAQVMIDPNRNIITKNNQVSLAVHDFEKEAEAISVVPNPASTEIDIVTRGSISVEDTQLYDAQGKLLAGNISLPYDIRHLSSGWYTLALNTTNGVFHKKFIKK